MSADEPKELGTLIVVVGKARNLVNKSRFGKQDPFCTVTWGEDKQKTKAIKRGGQHPEWDEELRFTIMEDTDDVLARSQSTSDNLASSTTSSSLGVDSPAGVTTAQALATKSRKGPIGKKGQKSLKLACYADDAKEPEMIGECAVPIEDVLKKGEVDEWYDIMYKEKYSGEVYLELTFYSNNAPPVKRNVPRPSVSNYGGAGVFDAGPSASPSQHRLTGSISASGSVSGMSLYIPPYAKPTDIAPIAHSSSFGNIGVPPIDRQQTPVPGQPSYPPSLAPNLVQNLSVDALTRPMSSMSLASTATGSRPLPPPTPTPAQHYGHPHRHSLGGVNEAPWGSLLPQSQPPAAPAPHPRPMSTNDAVPWDHLQRLEEERRRAGATPVPRPVSGQGYQMSWQGQGDPYRGSTPVPGSHPASLQVAGPPIPPAKHHHANSFSGQTATNLPIHGYSSPSPIPHPNSAPPTSNNRYLPSSSFGGVAQSIMNSDRSTAQSQNHGYSAEPYHRVEHYQPTPPRQDLPPQPYGTPTRQGSYPSRDPLPNTNGYQSPPPPTPPRETPYPPAQPPPQAPYGYAPSAPSAAIAQPTPSPSNGSYVPWYQQTQAAPPQDQYPPSSTPQSGAYPPSSSYSSPPPIPSYRPIPNPPAPPKPAAGYYPSDELYAQQPPPPRQPSPIPPWQSSQPTYPMQSSQANYSPSLNPQSYQPPHTPEPYHHSRHSYSGPPSSTTLPPAPDHRNSLGWQPPPPQALQSHQDYRSSSPLPPQPDYRAPSPIPPPQSQGYPDIPQNQTYRSPSTQPYTPPPNSLAPPSGNGPAQPSSRSPSPNPRQDWKSYMQNLSAGSAPANSYSAPPAPPQRSPSPQPPPKDWYTPPPTLPASIRPPDGWRSTLPADGPGQQWRS